MVKAGFEFDPRGGEELAAAGAGIPEVGEVGVIGVEEVGKAFDAGIVEGLGLDGEEAGGGEGGVFFRDQPADRVEEERRAVEEVAKVADSRRRFGADR